MKKVIFIGLALIGINISYCQTIVIDYFGQTPPGDSAVIFAPGIISLPGRYEHAAIFTHNGKEFYYGETFDWTNLKTYFRKFEDGSWTDEQVASFSTERNADEPTITLNDSVIIFTDGHDFWATGRNSTGWDNAEKLPGEINSKPYQWHPSVSANGTIYFSFAGDIYISKFKNQEYLNPVLLPSPINGTSWDADAVIAPDESFIIFNSNRDGSDADLFISYRKTDGRWTNPENLGDKINSEKMDDASSVSPDGKYFFFSRRTDEESDIYWVSTSFIDSLKHINFIPDSIAYLNQTPPGDNPEIFAGGIVSQTGRTENRITFSSDGKMCFFSCMGGPVYFTEYKNGGWTTPYMENNKFKSEPCFSPYGKRVYLNSRAAVNGVGGSDISYSDINDPVWNDPVSLGNPLNSAQDEYHPSIVSDTSVYFTSSSGSICKSLYKNGVYQKPEFLPSPVNVQSDNTYGDPYVAPDESYIIFRSGRQGNNVDIYISYKKTDGTWTNPKNAGNKINTGGEELSGDVTPDGKYFMFGREDDIYWVSSRFIDSLRSTNFIPYVKTTFANQKSTVGSQFNLKMPDNIFVDDDGNNTLKYAASLSDGSLLPQWISFDSISCNFSGMPDTADTLNIRVTAIDPAKETASILFKLEIENKHSLINHPIKQHINLYPNPVKGSLNISLESSEKDILVEISNIEGKVILKNIFTGNISIDLTGIPKGIYIVKFLADNDIITEMIFLE